jgi:predicted HTH domain antitoxin
MNRVAIEIPETILFELKIPRQRWKAELQKELALQLYRENLLSLGNARRLAGMTKLEFHDLLGERHIPRHYDIEDYETDLENLEKWGVNA